MRSGGEAEFFTIAGDADSLALAVEACGEAEKPLTLLGWGSNVLPSDDGVGGVVALNCARKIEWLEPFKLRVESGAGFQDVFLAAAQAAATGLEFAVGIPGTIGGALVSNAGAYRSEIGRLVTRVEVADADGRRWEDPSWLKLSYRDSRLRAPLESPTALLKIELRLTAGDPRAIYEAAREWQRQRISKQPPPASAGSFFKNVVDKELAERVDGLTPGMRASGVVPAGFLIEACGLKGHRLGGAMIGKRHANFLLNVGGAKASEIRSLAHLAKTRVRDHFGVEIEEEVLYLGDWTNYRPLTGS